MAADAPGGQYQENYSIWLEPAAASVAGMLQREIDAQVDKYQAPRFEPHVTLLGGIDRPRQEVLDTTAQLASQLKPLRLNMLDVSYGASFHQCVYLLAAKEPGLLAAGAAARKAFGMDPAAPYMPHCSLLYSDVPQEERREAAKAAVGRLYGEGSGYGTLMRDVGFTAASLSVWYTPTEDRSLASWVRVADVPLTG